MLLALHVLLLVVSFGHVSTLPSTPRKGQPAETLWEPELHCSSYHGKPQGNGELLGVALMGNTPRDRGECPRRLQSCTGCITNPCVPVQEAQALHGGLKTFS